MARTLKPSTQIKKQMESFITSNGLKKDIDTTIDGIRYFLVTPNRFGPGYIRIIIPQDEMNALVWTADLTRKDPTKTNTPKSRLVETLVKGLN